MKGIIKLIEKWNNCRISPALQLNLIKQMQILAS